MKEIFMAEVDKNNEAKEGAFSEMMNECINKTMDYGTCQLLEKTFREVNKQNRFVIETLVDKLVKAKEELKSK